MPKKDIFPPAPRFAQFLQEKFAEFAPLFLKGEKAVKQVKWEDLPIETKQYLTAIAKESMSYLKNYVVLNGIIESTPKQEEENETDHHL